MSRWEEEGLKVGKYPEMIPSKLKEDITNQFFGNYISSCLTVLEAAFEVTSSISSACCSLKRS